MLEYLNQGIYMMRQKYSGLYNNRNISVLLNWDFTCVPSFIVIYASKLIDLYRMIYALVEK